MIFSAWRTPKSGQFLRGLAGFRPMLLYRFRHVRGLLLWEDRVSLRALRFFSVVIILGACVMLLPFGEQKGTTEKQNVSLGAARNIPAAPSPLASSSFAPPVASVGAFSPDADALPPSPFSVSTAPGTSFSGPSVFGQERRGTLSANTSLDPEEGLRDGIRANAVPYDESAEAPLADVTRQVDAALIQTMARLSLGTGSLKLVNSETRFTADTLVYPFLRLEVASPAPLQQGEPGKALNVKGGLASTPGIVSPDLLADALAEALDVWAPAAHLHREGTDLFLISVGDAVTHSIRCGIGLAPEQVGPVRGQDEAQNGGEHRLTIIIDDIGENLTEVRTLLALPYPVTLSILPGSAHAVYAATLAHERDRQVFLHQPMEPVRQPGKPWGQSGSIGGLHVGMTREAMERDLRGNLRLVPYVEGINNHMGSKLTSHAASVRLFCEALRRLRPDILVLDSLTHGASVLYDEAREQGFVAFRRTLFLDDTRGAAAILGELDHGLELARKNGQVIVIGHPRSDTLSALAVWQGYRARDVDIVPLALWPDNTNGGSAAPDTEIP